MGAIENVIVGLKLERKNHLKKADVLEKRINDLQTDLKSMTTAESATKTAKTKAKKRPSKAAKK